MKKNSLGLDLKLAVHIGIHSPFSSRGVLVNTQASHDFCLAPWLENIFYDVESGLLCTDSKQVKCSNNALEETHDDERFLSQIEKEI